MGREGWDGDCGLAGEIRIMSQGKHRCIDVLCLDGFLRSYGLRTWICRYLGLRWSAAAGGLFYGCGILPCGMVSHKELA